MPRRNRDATGRAIEPEKLAPGISELAGELIAGHRLLAACTACRVNAAADGDYGLPARARSFSLPAGTP